MEFSADLPYKSGGSQASVWDECGRSGVLRSRDGLSAIETAAKRAKLPARANPYWRSVGGSRQGISLGYRKGASAAGVWVAKLVVNGTRKEERIGLADDAGSPPDALPFADASRRTLDWARREMGVLGATSSAPIDAALLTVKDAVDHYVTERKARSSKDGRDAETRLNRHVSSDPKIAQVLLGKLEAGHLQRWKKRLSSDLSPSSVNRLMNDFRAALNSAWESHRRRLPAGLPDEVRAGLKAVPGAEQARKQILPDADIRKLVSAAYQVEPEGEDFGVLALVDAATGARFSQLARLTVADVQRDAQRIMMPPARKGRPGKVKQKVPVPVGQDVIDALEPAIRGRAGHEPLLMKWRYVQTAPTTWVREKRVSWTSAAEAARPWKKAVALAGLPSDLVMYSLRHSSIVRALLANVPIRIVAVLHDTSVAMIEAHYSEYIMDVAQEVARRAVRPLAPALPTSLRIVA